MNESPLAQVDRLLHDYFQSELPRPWPQPRLPAPPVESFWRHSRLRVALAASVVLGLAGYLALAGYFPRPQATQAIEPHGPHIANVPKR